LFTAGKSLVEFEEGREISRDVDIIALSSDESRTSYVTVIFKGRIT